jgi:hypothetical protein
VSWPAMNSVNSRKGGGEDGEGCGGCHLRVGAYPVRPVAGRVPPCPGKPSEEDSARDAEQYEPHHVEEAGPVPRRASGNAHQVERDDPGEHGHGHSSVRAQITPDADLARGKPGTSEGAIVSSSLGR